MYYLCNMELEIFKDIEGYKGLYQVSNLGRVKSLPRVKVNNSGLRLIKGQILKPQTKRLGYLKVDLYKDGQQKSFFIHRLVATAFIPNPDNLPTVNHKDENPSNNMVENLEWCDNSYNINYGTAMKRAAKAKINHPKLSKKVLCVETGVIYPSTKEVQRQLGFSASNIAFCCRGLYETKYNYHWQYV